MAFVGVLPSGSKASFDTARGTLGSALSPARTRTPMAFVGIHWENGATAQTAATMYPDTGTATPSSWVNFDLALSSGAYTGSAMATAFTAAFGSTGETWAVAATASQDRFIPFFLGPEFSTITLSPVEAEETTINQLLVDSPIVVAGTKTWSVELSLRNTDNYVSVVNMTEAIKAAPDATKLFNTYDSSSAAGVQMSWERIINILADTEVNAFFYYRKDGSKPASPVNPEISGTVKVINDMGVASDAGGDPVPLQTITLNGVGTRSSVFV